jgi:hypothetical protein
MHGKNNINKCKDNVRTNLKIIKWDYLAGSEKNKWLFLGNKVTNDVFPPNLAK